MKHKTRSIADYDSYKVFLRDRIEQGREIFGRTYSHRELADACQVQTTYLSRFYRDSKTHLSADQLYRASRFLELSALEEEILFKLYEINRSTIPDRITQLKSRLERLKSRTLKTDSAIDAKKTQVSEQSLNRYYLDPYVSLVHMFFTIKKFQKNASLIRDTLGIHEKHFAEILKVLIDEGIIEKLVGSSVSEFRVREKNLHLPADSPLIGIVRSQMKALSLGQFQRKKSDHRAYSFNVLFTAEPEIRSKIQNLFLEFLKQVEEMVKKTKEPSEVFQLSFDLLPWT